MGEYSPIQPSSEHVLPEPGDYPPVLERVPQADDVDPYLTMQELAVRRVTYQGNELCNLSCPGCYLGQWLRPDGDVRQQNPTRKVDMGTFDAHLDALGPQVEELYAIGAELIAAPDHSRELIDRASARGLAVKAITNATRKPEIVDRTLKEGLDSGKIHKVVISLDSIEPEVNDVVRGRPGAAAATLENIRRFTEKGYPLKVQMTVWPRNYATILDTLHTLYDEYGVRGFSFHCGSSEAMGDDSELRDLLGGVLDPLAWRALTDRLAEFNEEHFDELQYFVYPYVYFTEEEMRQGVIGDDELTDQYLAHNEAVEQGSTEPLPFNGCPGVGVPQIYLYGNDTTPTGNGRVSACPIDSTAHDRFYAEWDEASGEFVTIADPARNQVQAMRRSPNYCPAVNEVTDRMNGTGSDRFPTEEGDLYHACRYISCNQMAGGSKKFPPEIYERFAAEYSAKFK